MHYVYVLKSTKNDEIYVGFTADLRRRLDEHNTGKVPSTASMRPWELAAYTAFQNPDKAHDFELYLKSHSGRAFLRKRLM
jgi:predicted GIY-YIG superfamily endonuclease